MWVIQRGNLLRLPDDVPVPPGSVRAEVPDDYLTNPLHYKIESDRVVRQPDAEIQALRKRSQEETLTTDDILRIKRAIAEGRL